MKYLATLFILLTLINCSGNKKVSKEKVADLVTQALCKKMLECQPQALPSEEYCNTMMKNVIQAKVQEIPEVSTTQKKLETCVSSIKGQTCDTLEANEPPPGCEFLAKK